MNVRSDAGTKGVGTIGLRLSIGINGSGVDVDGPRDAEDI